MGDIVRASKDQLIRAGYDFDSKPIKNLLELLQNYENQENTFIPKEGDHLWHPRLIGNLFARLIKGENLPDKRVVDSSKDLITKHLTYPWQKYLLEHIPQELFFDLPEEISNQTSMWRFSTYDNFLSDVVNTGGAMCATLLSMFFKPKTVVEFGVDAGWTTLLFCRCNPEARIHAIDNRARIQYNNLPTGCVALWHNINNLSLHIMNSYDFDMSGKVDLCFIDGCHDLPEVKLDTERAWENRNKDGDWCIAWDDYHPSNPDVFNTVNDFCKKVGHQLNKINAWQWIGSKNISEQNLMNYGI